MLPIKLKEATRSLCAPQDWDEKSYGGCDKLDIIDSDGIMYSYWKPTLGERIAILLGHKIRLCIIGSQHPPVAIDTNK